MSHTPRTDAAEGMRDFATGELEYVKADFARQLERELIELQHQLGIVKAILVKVEDERNELLRMIAEDEPLK